MAKHALVTLAAIVVATFCFVTPLILKYHVYKPSTISVASGDIVPVGEQISSVWCQGVELSSNSNFQSFLYETEPGVVPNEFQRTVTTHKIVLPDKSQEYWRFHLLRGSQVNIASCVRLFAGDLTVVKGHQGLRKCLKEHRHHIEREDISGEDSQSESESDDVTSSISSSQGAISNETDRIYVCKNALHHVALPTSYECNSLFGSLARKHVLEQDIEETAAVMKWDDFARQLTEASAGHGKCLFAAVHDVEDGECLGWHPKDVQQAKASEILSLQRAFRDPTMLYSTGIVLRDIKFTYVKVEDGNALLGRTTNLACIVMQAEIDMKTP